MPKVETKLMRVRGTDGSWKSVPALKTGGGGDDIPLATTETAGIVRVGENLAVTEDGILSAETDEDDFVEITNLEIEQIISNIGGI